MNNSKNKQWKKPLIASITKEYLIDNIKIFSGSDHTGAGTCSIIIGNDFFINR